MSLKETAIEGVQGLEKLKRLKSFYRNYNHGVLQFNGYHLAKIVVNGGWEEKLKIILNESCLALLTGGSLTHDQLAKLMGHKNYKTQLRDLGVIC
mgnify:CR=1 FL=1